MPDPSRGAPARGFWRDPAARYDKGARTWCATHRRTALEGVATLAAAAVALLLFAAAPALAVTPTFATPAGFAVGDSPHAIVTGDFNRDGRPDVAVADSGSDTVSILLGLGNGKLAAAKSIKVGTQPTGVAVADFNGDGKLDLAVANSGSNTVSILRGNGAGGFTLVQSIAVGAGPCRSPPATSTTTADATSS